MKKELLDAAKKRRHAIVQVRVIGEHCDEPNALNMDSWSVMPWKQAEELFDSVDDPAKDLVVQAGAPGYEHIRSLTCKCGHHSIRDNIQMENFEWTHRCPGCGMEHTVAWWSGEE